MGFLRTITWIVIVALFSVLLSHLLRGPVAPLLYGGHVEPGFEAVEHAFRRNFETGYEKDGAAFAVCHKGKMVVDIWGGYADRMALRPWKEDTMTTAFSTTKGVAALCIAQLVDRGYLSYNDLVIKHWPEFGANGKANVTVKMLIGHEAGLAAIDEPIPKEAVKNWRLMSKLFENQTPNWPPGSTSGYHIITFGWVVDQLIRRTDPKRRGVGQYFQEEIAVPNGIDFFIGLPRDQLHRVARLTGPTFWDYFIRLDDWDFVSFLWRVAQRQLHPISKQALSNPSWLYMLTSYLPFNDPDIREMEIAGGGGIGTARAMARLYCLLSDEKRPLLSKKVLDIISKPAIYTPDDAVLGMNLTWGYGFMHRKNPEGHDTFGHPGYGGQNTKFDRHENLAYAYLRNNISPEFVGDLVRTFRNLERATYESVRGLKAK